MLESSSEQNKLSLYLAHTVLPGIASLYTETVSVWDFGIFLT